VISARPGNPGAPNDQQIYLRALRTIPNLSITYGHFLTHSVPADGQERLWAFIGKNDEMETSIRDKGTIVDLLKRSLASARNSVIQADDAAFGRRLTEETTA
jgi:hypothetical protein